MAITISNVDPSTGAALDDEIPIIVSGDTSTSVRITSSKVTIKLIYWYNPTTIAHLMAIQDRNGSNLFPMKCVVATQSQISGPISIPADGIYMDDLDSGTVYIYFEKD